MSIFDVLFKSKNNMTIEEAREGIDQCLQEMDEIIKKCPPFEQKLYKDIKTVLYELFNNIDNYSQQELELTVRIIETKLRFLEKCLDRIYDRK